MFQSLPVPNKEEYEDTTLKYCLSRINLLKAGLGTITKVVSVSIFLYDTTCQLYGDILARQKFFVS